MKNIIRQANPMQLQFLANDLHMELTKLAIQELLQFLKLSVCQINAYINNFFTISRQEGKVFP